MKTTETYLLSLLPIEPILNVSNISLFEFIIWLILLILRVVTAEVISDTVVSSNFVEPEIVY